MTLAGRLRSSAPPNVRPGLILAFLVLVIAALAWPFPRGTAPTGLDPSWQMGLHMAAQVPLRQGVDIAFTYGPLGFLALPTPYLGSTTLLALIACFAISASLVAVLIIGARRVVPLWAAAVLALIVARLVVVLPPWETLQAVVFVLVLAVIARPPSRRGLVVAAGFGFLAGVAILGKLNTGVFIAAVTAIAAAAAVRPAWRGLASFGGAAGVTALTLWLLAGQRLTDLGPYALYAYQTISGYSAAMGTERTAAQAWLYVPFSVLVVLLVWLAAQARQDWTSRQRAALVGAGLVMGFALWKTAFTRWFPDYAFASFAIIIFAFPFTRPAIGTRVWVISLLAVLLAFTGIAPPRARVVAVIDSARSLASELREAVVPSLASAAEDRTRAELQAAYQLPPAILADLAGRRTHIDPWEIGVAFAYPSMAWDPLPVFQSYEAWTPALDELNAARLRSDQGPERILRRYVAWPTPPAYVQVQLGRPIQPGETFPVTVDGRYRWFESPAAMLETFCRYREVAADATWQVLVRTAASCGSPEPISTLTAARGVPVTVPAATPGTFTIVRIRGIEPSPIVAIRTAIWKAPEWYVTVDGTRYRLVAATAADGLLLSVPSSVEGSGPFAFGPSIRTIAVSAGLSAAQSDDHITYEFLRVPLAAAP